MRDAAAQRDNLARVYGLENAEGPAAGALHALVMAFVEGEDLDTVVVAGIAEITQDLMRIENFRLGVESPESWRHPQTPESVPTRSASRSASAAWARCIARPTRT